MAMKEEYESLRAEIGNWQNFRFILVGVATAFVSTVIGFEPKQGTEGAPRLRLSLIIFALAGAAALSCYAGWGNAKIGAYLQVFHEQSTSDKKYTLGWEGRNQKFQGSQWNLLSLNGWLGITYLLLGIGSSIALVGLDLKKVWPINIDPRILDPSDAILEIAWLCLVVAAVSLFLPPPRARYMRRWRDVEIEFPVGEQQRISDLTVSQLRELIRDELKQSTPRSANING